MDEYHINDLRTTICGGVLGSCKRNHIIVCYIKYNCKLIAYLCTYVKKRRVVGSVLYTTSKHFAIIHQ
jgi:hypothetical protein